MRVVVVIVVILAGWACGGMEKGVSMSDTTIIFVSASGKWPKRKTFAYVICMGSQLPSMIRI